ncbi:dimethylarginine dimethylaminohydrolase family protein [Amycolatopsis sp. NPDC003676]
MSASTLGGDGWRPRVGGHADDVAGGRVWAACGYRSEVSRLREVLLARPPDTIEGITDPARFLMAERVDLMALRAQAAGLAEVYTALGVTVHMAVPSPDAPPNVIFMRDLFLATPQGAILARTAAEQRRGEERHACAALAGLGVPILRTPTGTATFEGADALWADERTVLVGHGFRTNLEGVRVVRDVLREQGVDVIAVPLGKGVQHLLGSVVFIDRDLAAVHAAAAGPRLRAELTARGYETLEFPPDEELTAGRGMNVVTIAPREVLMPAGCPGIRDRLERAGIRTHTADVGEYVKAAGGVGCLTGILRRD